VGLCRIRFLVDNNLINSEEAVRREKIWKECYQTALDIGQVQLFWLETVSAELDKIRSLYPK
jgi:hypothetical protein